VDVPAERREAIKRRPVVVWRHGPALLVSPTNSTPLYAFEAPTSKYRTSTVLVQN
jgi:hypothetical protein